MIGVRVGCDADDCARHFNLDGQIDLNPRAQTGPRGEAFIVFAVPFVALPAGWTATQSDDGHALQLRCAEHAPAEDGAHD